MPLSGRVQPVSTSCAKRTTIAPSPTAPATRFDAPARAVYVATAQGVATPPVAGAFVAVLRMVAAELSGEMRARGLRLPVRRS